MSETQYRDVKCSRCGSLEQRINGAWLREQREAAGVSLRTLAKRLKFSAPYLSDVENDRRRCTDKILDAYTKLQRGATA